MQLFMPRLKRNLQKRRSRETSATHLSGKEINVQDGVFAIYNMVLLSFRLPFMSLQSACSKLKSQLSDYNIFIRL